MGILQIETPDGIEKVEIQGEEPTEEELSVITETFFGKPDASAEEMVTGAFDRVQTPREDRQEFKPTHEGEVKDLSLQYYVGRGDTDEERLLRLTEVFGQEGVTQVGVDDFVLNLDTITEEVKEKFNLPESGTIRFNQPGLGWQDVAGFLGRETVPLVAAVGASIAATGMGAPTGITLVGAEGAAGKAIDEFIFEDIFEGLQR